MVHPIELMQAAIDFASLGLSPILVDIPLPFTDASLPIRWYSLGYIGGVVVAWWYILRMIAAPGAPMARRHVDDFVTWIVIGIIAGGRLGYVLFYDLPKYQADPVAALRIWDGGMSFHGGLIGVLLAVWGFTRVNKLDWMRFQDYVAVTIPFGLCFGRLANFNNGELWGRVTDVPWGVIFPGAGPDPRHPSQLYEAFFEGPVLFAILWWLFWKTDARHKPGFLLGAFALGYGVFRFGIEYFREPDVQLGVLSFGLTMGQTLCLPLIVGGAWFIATANGRKDRIALVR
jgi:phosphatidylglycerol---prolipoprotein diacylglyceryl transferase